MGFLALYAVVGAGFYWLMQPTVIQNRGLAGYQAPPKAVVSYVPWVPPDPSEADTFVAAPRPAPEPEPSSVSTAKTEVKTHEARAPARRERHVRTRPAPAYNNAIGRAFAFRPWF